MNFWIKSGNCSGLGSGFVTQEKDVASRIDLFEADFEKENLPAEKFDFMFLGNIIHGLNEEGNKALFKKIANATASNGVIAILDQYTNVKDSLFVSPLLVFFTNS